MASNPPTPAQSYFDNTQLERNFREETLRNLRFQGGEGAQEKDIAQIAGLGGRLSRPVIDLRSDPNFEGSEFTPGLADKLKMYRDAQLFGIEGSNDTEIGGLFATPGVNYRLIAGGQVVGQASTPDEMRALALQATEMGGGRKANLSVQGRVGDGEYQNVFQNLPDKNGFGEFLKLAIPIATSFIPGLNLLATMAVAGGSSAGANLLAGESLKKSLISGGISAATAGALKGVFPGGITAPKADLGALAAASAPVGSVIPAGVLSGIADTAVEPLINVAASRIAGSGLSGLAGSALGSAASALATPSQPGDDAPITVSGARIPPPSSPPSLAGIGGSGIANLVGAGEATGNFPDSAKTERAATGQQEGDVGTYGGTDPAPDAEIVVSSPRLPQPGTIGNLLSGGVSSGLAGIGGSLDPFADAMDYARMQNQHSPPPVDGDEIVVTGQNPTPRTMPASVLAGLGGAALLGGGLLATGGGGSAAGAGLGTLEGATAALNAAPVYSLPAAAAGTGAGSGGLLAGLGLGSTGNIIRTALGGVGVLSGLGGLLGIGGGHAGGAGTGIGGNYGTYSYQPLNRTQNVPTFDPFTYGQNSGEFKFFNDATPTFQTGIGAGIAPAPGGLAGIAPQPPVPVRFAKGGHIRGIGGGQDDLIDAKLSDGEYVISAQDVSDLGDGSNQAGAKRLDQMRRLIRKNAGRKNIKTIARPQKSVSSILRAVK